MFWKDNWIIPIISVYKIRHCLQKRRNSIIQHRSGKTSAVARNRGKPTTFLATRHKKQQKLQPLLRQGKSHSGSSTQLGQSQDQCRYLDTGHSHFEKPHRLLKTQTTPVARIEGGGLHFSGNTNTRLQHPC